MGYRVCWVGLGAVALFGAACTALLGDDFEIASTSTTSVGGSGAVGGTGGQNTGGMGGGGATACVPGTDTPCYSGPPETENVGPCHGGTRRCNEQGTGFGPCTDEVLPQPEDCATSVDEDCSGGDCTGNGVFAQVYGEGVGMRIARDANDAVLLTGTVSGTVNFGGDNIIASSASGDGYVVKLDHAFGHLWDLHLTGNSVEEPRGIAVDPSGNVAVAGRFQTELVVDGTTYPGVGEDEIFVLRLSPAGAVQWVKVYANNINQQARAVAMDSTGATIVAGYYEGTLDFGGGHVLTSTDGWDMFLLKLDGAGNTLWAKSYGGTGADMLQGVAVDGDDNIFVVGNYAGQMTFGCLTHAASSEGSGLIAKLAANGDCVWSDAFGGAGEQTVGLDVEVDSGGRPVFGGAFTGTLPFPSSQLVSNGNMDTFVAKYTATGLHMWSLSFGGAGLDEPCFVAVDPVDAVVVTGRTQSDLDFGEGLLTNHGSQDLFVAKYAGATGALVWGRLIGDADYQAGFNVTTDRLGWPILTGQITGTVDFGNGPLSTSLLNAFIAKLEP